MKTVCSLDFLFCAPLMIFFSVNIASSVRIFLRKPIALSGRILLFSRWFCSLAFRHLANIFDIGFPMLMPLESAGSVQSPDLNNGIRFELFHLFG